MRKNKYKLSFPRALPRETAPCPRCGSENYDPKTGECAVDWSNGSYCGNSEINERADHEKARI